MVMTTERLLTVKEVAERLRVHPVTIRRWLLEGRIRGSQPGGAKIGWRIPESEVTRILEETQGRRQQD